MRHANFSCEKTAIIEQLGYFPAFLIPAVNSSLIYPSIIQETLFAYINNPLPIRFKEKLFISLSRYFGVRYFTICHSCSLYSLGCSAAEILQLEIEYPRTQAEVKAHFQTLCDRLEQEPNWQDNCQIETSLLHCSNYIFLHRERTVDFAAALEKVIGTVDYHYLILLLDYIKLCHQWVESNPQISHQQDRRSQLYLGSLLLEDNRLVQFLQAEVRSQTDSVTILAKDKIHRDGSSMSIDRQSAIDIYLRLKQKALTTNCLTDILFPVMIHNHRGQVIYCNRKWLSATGYNASEISTIAKWNCKAMVKQQELIKLPAKRSEKLSEEWIDPTIQTTKTAIVLQQIVDNLVGISSDIARTKFPGDRQISNIVRSQVIISSKSGKQLYWEQYSTVLSIDGSEDQLTVAIAQDLTCTIERENELAELETRLNLVLETTKTGTWTWNLATNQIDLCDRACSILRLKDFDGSYHSFLQSIHPSEREFIDLAAARAVQAHQDLDLKYHGKIDGDSLIRVRGKLLYSAEGQPIRLTGIVCDLTSSSSERAKNTTVEQQRNTVQFSEDLEKTIDLLPYYLFVINVKSNTIAAINSGLARSLCLSISEAKGKTLAECFAPKYAKKMAWQHQQVITYKQKLQFQEKLALPDGLHYFDTVITPLYDDRKEIHALLHTFSDLPDLAATQEALSQRTIQLEAANRELESFSYSVSHDLQAPLRVINGFSQVLWENYRPHLDDRGQHYLQRIQANSQRMSDLIDALLGLSRVTRSQMKSSKVNLSAIALNIIAELTAQDPQRQVEVTIAPNLEVNGDPQLLRIALCNLFNNAWKYTSKRSPAKIEFDVLTSDEGATTYYLRDNGAGFDRDYTDKLFKAFQRLHSQEEFPGTGIGLATVQRIIFRHGGKVWAEGECDRGATIYFSL